MNKLYSFLLVFVAFIASSIPFSTLYAQVVVDYYNLLADYDDDIKMHALTQESGHWYAQAPNAAKTKVTVDNKHNFLELKDKEKDGIFTMQVSVFSKANGENLVAVVKNHLDIFLHGEIQILKYKNGRWFDVTEEVMPTITYKDFSEQTLSLEAAAFNPMLNHHLEFGYQLPHHSGNSKALMQTQILKEKCAQKDPAVKDYCGSLSEISYASIELIWNEKTGKFTLGEKHR